MTRCLIHFVSPPTRYDKISEKKMSTPIELLCKNYPAEFANYLNYCRYVFVVCRWGVFETC